MCAEKVNYNQKKIAVVGLGYVGLPLAVEFGKVRPVIGFDKDNARVRELANKKDVTLEVSPDELRAAIYLDFSCEEASLSECDIFIIAVQTPIDTLKRPNLSALIAATDTVGRLMRPGAIVIFESTVYPGCTEEICVPILEDRSGLIFNEQFFCGYSPERINPGDKINTLTKIKKITSGSTAEALDIIDELYASIINAGTWKASSIAVAEAAKVIENSQRDLNIAFVNELSIIFERMGIDTIEVLEAAGSKWNFIPYRPGMVGGHCIGVDPYYLTHKAEEMGYRPQVILAGRRINDNMSRYVARKVIQLMLKNGLDVARCKIGVMGVTFKENCPDIRNSKVVDLVKELINWGADVVVTDPLANSKEVMETYEIDLGVINHENPVDSLIVAVGHNEFRELNAQQLKSLCRSEMPVLGDVKALFDRHDAVKAGFTVFRL
jgi:UDP-N-acetyl-D-glucosamine/UDP-N-acetyl-D-galactosamine dehydrogenase